MPPKDVPIVPKTNFVAPTPQNTPLHKAPIAQQAPTIPDTIDEDASADDVAQALAARLNIASDDEADAEADIQDLPLAVRRRIEGLKGVHLEYTKVEKDYKREVLELDRKVRDYQRHMTRIFALIRRANRQYAGLYQPIFARRAAIVNGSQEPTAEEVTAGEEQTLKDDPDADPLAADEDEDVDVDVKGVPHFWLTALRNHQDMSLLITERDQEVFGLHITHGK